MQVYDVANIANKGISQRIITAPYSDAGHDTHIESRDARCVALATNQPVHPVRNQGELMRVDNQEQPFHPIYDYAFIIDADEGLILTDVNTLSDGEPRNNFLERQLTWNPAGVLSGARHITLAGHIAYVPTPRGIVVLDLDDPLRPAVLATIPLPTARAPAVQFRYLFVTDADGLKVVDITYPAQPRIIEDSLVELDDAHKVYVARTYAYVAAGDQGVAIIDVETATRPQLKQLYNAGGRLNDARDVIVGTTNASLFAYVADGRNGLKVVQLTSPATQPKFYGFSPEPKPFLVAEYRTGSPALALSKGLDRDRAVDETGHQMAVFGRLGSRPFTLEEMQRLYLDDEDKVWKVSDDTDNGSYVK